MIIDTLENSALYEKAHPLFAKAFAFLKSAPLATMEPGKVELEGDSLYASIQEPEGKPQSAAKLEYHRKYIDIQYVVSGNEGMGWAPLCGLGHDTGYDEKGDFGLFKDAPQSFFDVRPGCFAIFFPGDAHAPCLGTGIRRKVVIKVKVQ